MCVGFAALHRDKIDQACGSACLPGEMKAEIRLIHRRDRMAGHHGMPVQPMDGTTCRREKMSRCLIATHAGIGDDHRYPAVEPS